MSERSRKFLIDIYGVPAEKIDLIPHGIPDMPFVDPNFFKDQFDVEGKFVALTFGLLSPNKGIENVLQRDAESHRASRRILCTSFWAPRIRISCASRAKRIGSAWSGWRRSWTFKKHVIFYNRFVELRELTEFIGAADIYITPYLNPAQAVSGTLAYSFGCGKAVISTPYWHAEELLADDRGILVPFGDSDAIARAIIDLWQDEPRRNAMRKRAYLMGREMIWSHVAHLYMESFQRARHSRPPALAKIAGRPHARRGAAATSRDAVRALAADDRFDGRHPARHVLDSEFSRRLLPRRQCPGAGADGAAGGAGHRFDRNPAGGNDVRGVLELCVRLRRRAASAIF